MPVGPMPVLMMIVVMMMMMMIKSYVEWLMDESVLTLYFVVMRMQVGDRIEKVGSVD